ncbi:MAG: hypothetical protein UZ13_01509 [Chloroflexi bacterium OLB13]|nr:MAG: hypothetical protein UZ13_01509 [Chloroflexi bacterium OLB13]RIK36777.1 MAG: hypothetical protein DCC55_26260 [Chloroflexota bacterium]
MATLTVLSPSHLAGSDLDAAAAAGAGDQFLNDGRTILYVKNTNAASRTVTIVTSPTVAGLALADVAVVVAQNEEKLIGPFDPRYFNDSNGFVQITYSSEVDVTVRPIQVK